MKSRLKADFSIPTPYVMARLRRLALLEEKLHTLAVQSCNTPDYDCSVLWSKYTAEIKTICSENMIYYYLEEPGDGLGYNIWLSETPLCYVNYITEGIRLQGLNLLERKEDVG